MHTTNTTRRAGFPAYAAVIVLMAFSAVLGAVAGTAWTLPSSPIMAPAPAPSIDQVPPLLTARTANLSEIDPLIQEQRDLRQAKRIRLGLPGVINPQSAISSPAPSASLSDADSAGKALEQEMRDVKQFERFLRDSALTAPADTTTAPVFSGHERYRLFKDKQLEGAY